MNLQKIFETYFIRLEKVQSKHKRYLFEKIDFNQKLISILGQRGVGKTTLLLQYLKENVSDTGEALYLSLDAPWFASVSLFELAKEFEQYGGKVLVLDEVHKYENWAGHIKQICDLLELKVLFSGSSILQIQKQDADLSRRCIVYHLENLSFREYLKFNGIELADYTLEEILTNHIEIAQNISSQIKPLVHFREYLRYGAYPFFLEGKSSYYQKITQILNTILESDLAYIDNVNIKEIKKLKKLLYLLAVSVPFMPNITDIAQATSISRPKVYDYLELLERAKIINSVRTKEKGYNILAKPEKVFMQNPNLSYAIANEVDRGTLRESFFVNQLKNSFELKNTFIDETIYTSKRGDFLVKERYTFEIGGKNKSFKQIKDIDNSFVAADDIEVGFGNKIPLWLFGFLY